MELVAISLGVAILVVLILLFSCWETKPKRKPSGRSCSQSRKNVDLDFDNDPAAKSDWGTGVTNRRVSKQYSDLQNLSGYDDYNSVAQYSSLEPEVFESHEEYSKDINRSTAGASAMSARSDSQDVVPWVGLRRPSYRDVYAGDGARQEHSEIPDQMPAATHYLL